MSNSLSNSVGSSHSGSYDPSSSRFGTRYAEIAFLGDSFTNRISGVNQFQARGFANVAKAVLNQRFDYTARTGGTDWDFGYSGWDAHELEDGVDPDYPVTLVGSSDAEVVFVLAGINDVQEGDSSSTVVDYIVSLHQAIRLAGKKTWGATLAPVGSGAGATKRDVVAAINAALPSALAAIGVPCCQWHGEITVDVDGYATSDMLEPADNYHVSIPGAYKLGLYLADWLDSKVSTIPQFVPPVSGDSSWITPNPYVSGDTAGKADSLLTLYGAANHAYSKANDGDEWQQIVTSGQSLGDTNAVYLRDTSGSHVGKTLRCCCRLECETADWDSKGVLLWLRCETSGYVHTGSVYDHLRNDTTFAIATDPWDGLLLTPPITVPASTDFISARIYWYGDSTIRVRQLGAFEVT